MAKLTFIDFLFSQWARLSPPLYVDLEGKTVVVIGANAGIGFEAAKRFAKMKPARLIIGCRSEDRGRKAAEAIAAETGYATELQLIDLAKFSSVQDFAARIGDAPVDILVMNAGVVEIQVNHLATALLSLLLTPNMARAAQEHNSNSRLVVVSSETHFWAHLEKVLSAPHLLEALNDKEYCSNPGVMDHRYPDILNVFFTRAFASNLKTSIPVIATTVNPGMDALLGRSAEGGARQLVWAALGPDGKTGHHEMHLQGAYVSNATVLEPSDLVISKEGYETQEKLWRETVDILKHVNPNVASIILTYF